MSTPNGNAGNGLNIGKVVQVIGPVLDVEFAENHLPPIYTALRVTSEGFDCRRPLISFAKSNSNSAKAASAPAR